MANSDKNSHDRTASDTLSLASSASSEDEIPMVCGPCDCPPTAHYSLGTALLLVGTLLFVICCSELVPASVFTQDFESTKCTIVSAQFVDDVCCESDVKSLGSCEKDYDYPCASVAVTYEDGGDVIAAILYDDYKSRAFRSQTAKENGCSYFRCGSASYKDHRKDAKKFLNKYDEIGERVTCYVDPKNHKHVALITTSSAGALAAMLTVSLVLMLTGSVICLIMFIMVKKREREMHRQSQSDGKPMIRDDASDMGTRSTTTPDGVKHVCIGSSEKKADTRPTTRNGVKFQLTDA